jgi:single-strand DNA-binding protein
MSGDTLLTVVGNLVADVELKFLPSGVACGSFTVASTPRSFDKTTNAWKDQEPLFMRCTIWRQAAENVCESLTRGTRVIVTGRLKQRSFETREGERRTVIEMDVDDVGPSLKFASAKVNKVSRGSDGGGFSGGVASEDPWGSTPVAGGGGSDDIPPF